MLIFKRVLFYIASFTGGALMSVIGAIITLVLLPFGKQGVYHGRIYTEIGENGGGLELGCFFICSKNPDEHLKAHEAGHGLQNCLWGPLFPFVIMIPSAIRYGIFAQKNYKEKQNLATAVVTIILSIAAISVILPVGTGLAVLYTLTLGIAFYGCFISCGLFCKELPLHEGENPDYDDAGFEGQATSGGFEYIATDKI